MNNFTKLLEELESKSHKYICYICGKVHSMDRPKYKHNRKKFEDSGKGVVVDGNFYCKKCVKTKISD